MQLTSLSATSSRGQGYARSEKKAAWYQKAKRNRKYAYVNIELEMRKQVM
jgi:hypothetical protein